MKSKLILILVISLSCLSCARFTEMSHSQGVQSFAIIAGLAAEIGTTIYLDAHPEQREAFKISLIALGALCSAGNTNVDAYAELLNSLPTSTFDGPLGSVYVSSGLVVWDGVKATAVKGKFTFPVACAIVAGIRRGVIRP